MLGEKIKSLREQKDWSISFCAKQLGIDSKTWKDWEENKVTPRVFFICCMAELFAVTTDELLRDENGGFMV